MFSNVRIFSRSLQGRSLQEIEQLEKDLRRALDGVCKERERTLQAHMVKEEQRLCVVCQVGLYRIIDV